VALDAEFAALRPLMQPLQQLCAKRPGLLVADHGFGNHVLFHTRCAVVANNFILTDEDIQRWQVLNASLRQNPAELAVTFPQARYLLVVQNPAVYGAEMLRLLTPDAVLPPGMVLLGNLNRTRIDGQLGTFAALFYLKPSPQR
jgi:hypothetical protein